MAQCILKWELTHIRSVAKVDNGTTEMYSLLQSLSSWIVSGQRKDCCAFVSSCSTNVCDTWHRTDVIPTTS